jgi:hypothetical protein
VEITTPRFWWVFTPLQKWWKFSTVAFTQETFGECFHKAAVVKSNGNVRLGVKIANSVHSKCYGKTANIKVKNFSV